MGHRNSDQWDSKVLLVSRMEGQAHAASQDADNSETHTPLSAADWCGAGLGWEMIVGRPRGYSKRWFTIPPVGQGEWSRRKIEHLKNEYTELTMLFLVLGSLRQSHYVAQLTSASRVMTSEACTNTSDFEIFSLKSKLKLNPVNFAKGLNVPFPQKSYIGSLRWRLEVRRSGSD